MTSEVLSLAVSVPPSVHACGDQHPNEKDDQNGDRQERRNEDRPDLDRVRRDHGSAVGVFDPVSPDQKPVGVDAVRRACDQGAQILAFFNLEVREILRLYDPDMVHLVGEGLIEDRHREGVSFPELIEVCKKPRRGKSPVPGKQAVGALSAHRQR